MSVLFPDRERRHLLQFHVLPRIGYRMRFLIAALLVIGGLALQVLYLGGDDSGAVLLGTLLVAAGNLLLLLKGFDLRRTDTAVVAGIGDWERTSEKQLIEVQFLEDEISGWDESIVDITSWSGAFALLLLVALPLFIVWVVLISRWGGESMANLFLVDALLLVVPHWLTGLRRKWRPLALREIVDSLQAALAAIKEYDGPPCQIQPMFLMAGEGKARVPVDARAFVRFPDGPEDFLGLQLQVSINAVQGTNYPYLYAVIVARDSFKLHERFLKSVEEGAWDLTVETSTEEGVEVIVIRQHTTSTSGYHTGPVKVQQIARTAWERTAWIIGSPVE